METKAKYIAILPVRVEPNGGLPAFVVPRLLRIEDATKYLSATTWQMETLLREKTIPSFVLGKRRGRSFGTSLSGSARRSRSERVGGN